MKKIKPPDLYGYTIFCDDIRHEVGGKISIIGVYSGVMLTQAEFPLVLPKFCFNIHFFQAKAKVRSDCRINVFFPGDKEEEPSMITEFPQLSEKSIEKASERSPLPKSKQGYLVLRSSIILSPVTISRPGEINVRVIHGDSTINVGKLSVMKITDDIKKKIFPTGP